MSRFGQKNCRRQIETARSLPSKSADLIVNAMAPRQGTANVRPTPVTVKRTFNGFQDRTWKCKSPVATRGMAVYSFMRVGAIET